MMDKQVNLYTVGSELDKGFKMITNECEAKILKYCDEISVIAQRCDFTKLTLHLMISRH